MTSINGQYARNEMLIYFLLYMRRKWRKRTSMKAYLFQIILENESDAKEREEIATTISEGQKISRREEIENEERTVSSMHPRRPINEERRRRGRSQKLICGRREQERALCCLEEELKKSWNEAEELSSWLWRKSLYSLLKRKCEEL